MPKNPLYMKRTKMGSYEKSDQYKDEIRKKTSMSSMRDTRNSMNAKSSGVSESFVAAMNYIEDSKRKKRLAALKR